MSNNMGVRFQTVSGSEYTYENNILSGGKVYSGPARLDSNIEAGKPAFFETLFGPLRTSKITSVTYYGL